MALTDNLRRQHKELGQIVDDLISLLQSDKIIKNSKTIRGVLATLAGKLTIHLQMEDKSLYPHLLSHKNDHLISLTSIYINEMGGIQDSFDSFLKRWPTSGRIQENPEGFIRETKGIIEILLNRISKEDEELYPLVDQLLS